VLGPFDRQHPRHLDERALRDTVDRSLGGTDQPMRRGQIDDRTRPAVGDEAPADLLREKEGSGQVGRHDGVPLGPSHVDCELA
jgi:hypothetical protein